MRKLIVFVVILAVLWGGYWFIGSTTKHRVIEAWLTERRAAGWTASYSDFRVVGFPNRFDSKFTDLDISDPRSGIEWLAPGFDILALSYQPNHIIAIWPNRQTLRLPGEEIDVTSAELVASVVFEPDTKLALSRISLEARELVLKGVSGWTTGISALRASTRQNADKTFAHDVIFDAKAVSPTAAFLKTLDPAGKLPGVIDRLFLDMTLGFDAPWDRVAIEQGAPLVQRITIRRLDTVWGPLGVGGTGTLDVAKNGSIDGEVALEIRNWRAVVDLFVTSGAIDPSTAQTIKTGLEFLAADGDSIKTSLVIKNGQMSLGPVPLGAAPTLIRR